MKIEIGESLVYSWLLHIKQCQIVQTNWRPSKSWPQNDVLLQDLKTGIEKEFDGSGFDIFKKTASISQFLHQAEIDALGVSYNIDGTPPEYYLVDVAFHEGGLNYGDPTETVARVLKKFIRSYFIFLSYFNVSDPATIYFMAPKVQINTLNSLLENVEKLTTIFHDKGFLPHFECVANHDFRDQVLIPTMDICDDVADTNELFLRSFQLWKMFEEEKNSTPAGIKIPTNPKIPITHEGQLIGKYVVEKLRALIRSGCLPESEVKNLLQPTYSKKTFNLGFSFLRRFEDGRLDDKGYSRYYSDPWTVNDTSYYFCSQWLEKQRKSFDDWLVKMGTAG